MDKKSRERTRNIDYKKTAIVALVVGLIFGISLCVYSGYQLYEYRKELGNRTVEELNEDANSAVDEYLEIEKEKIAELEANGYSDKYIELNNKSARALMKQTSANHSLYMIDTGYHNPRNLWELLITQPLLFVGIFMCGAGVVSFFVLKNKAKK
jgi:hypothetical protein